MASVAVFKITGEAVPVHVECIVCRDPEELAFALGEIFGVHDGVMDDQIGAQATVEVVLMDESDLNAVQPIRSGDDD